jgi:pSer/pThr/pTyr-binding forkhead associated (FHA) protein
VAVPTLGLVVRHHLGAHGECDVGSQPAILTWRDGSGQEHIHTLYSNRDRIVVGRGQGSDLHLEGDPRVSRTHAVLEHVDGEWTIVDDRLSRNGTFVNGERVLGRRRLWDGDVLRMGRTSLLFRDGAH